MTPKSDDTPKPQFDDPIFKQWEAEPRDKYLKIHYGDLTTIVWAMLRRFRDKDAKSLEERDREIAELKNEKQALLALAANHKNMRKEDLKAIESANAGLAEEIMKSTALEIKLNQVDMFFEAKLKEERERASINEKKLRAFKPYGTDGCKSCESGRVTLFIANDECLTCNPESYGPKQFQSETP